jgi:hypothetical protein
MRVRGVSVAAMALAYSFEKSSERP